MKTKFVQVLFDIFIDFDLEQDREHPRYRVFVADELFTERTYTWTEDYLEEMLQIEAPPGQYPIRVELVQPTTARLKVRNERIKLGPASIRKSLLEIRNED